MIQMILLLLLNVWTIKYGFRFIQDQIDAVPLVISGFCHIVIVRRWAEDQKLVRFRSLSRDSTGDQKVLKSGLTS